MGYDCEEWSRAGKRGGMDNVKESATMLLLANGGIIILLLLKGSMKTWQWGVLLGGAAIGGYFLLKKQTAPTNSPALSAYFDFAGFVNPFDAFAASQMISPGAAIAPFNAIVSDWIDGVVGWI
jgi:hypothetical protein